MKKVSFAEVKKEVIEEEVKAKVFFYPKKDGNLDLDYNVTFILNSQPIQTKEYTYEEMKDKKEITFEFEPMTCGTYILAVEFAEDSKDNIQNGFVSEIQVLAVYESITCYNTHISEVFGLNNDNFMIKKFQKGEGLIDYCKVPAGVEKPTHFICYDFECLALYCVDGESKYVYLKKQGQESFSEKFVVEKPIECFFSKKNVLYCYILSENKIYIFDVNDGKMKNVVDEDIILFEQKRGDLPLISVAYDMNKNMIFYLTDISNEDQLFCLDLNSKTVILVSDNHDGKLLICIDQILGSFRNKKVFIVEMDKKTLKFTGYSEFTIDRNRIALKMDKDSATFQLEKSEENFYCLQASGAFDPTIKKHVEIQKKFLELKKQSTDVKLNIVQLPNSIETPSTMKDDTDPKTESKDWNIHYNENKDTNIDSLIDEETEEEGEITIKSYHIGMNLVENDFIETGYDVKFENHTEENFPEEIKRKLKDFSDGLDELKDLSEEMKENKKKFDEESDKLLENESDEFLQKILDVKMDLIELQNNCNSGVVDSSKSMLTKLRGKVESLKSITSQLKGYLTSLRDNLSFVSTCLSQINKFIALLKNIRFTLKILKFVPGFGTVFGVLANVMGWMIPIIENLVGKFSRSVNKVINIIKPKIIQAINILTIVESTLDSVHKYLNVAIFVTEEGEKYGLSLPTIDFNSQISILIGICNSVSAVSRKILDGSRFISQMRSILNPFSTFFSKIEKFVDVINWVGNKLRAIFLPAWWCFTLPCGCRICIPSPLWLITQLLDIAINAILRATGILGLINNAINYAVAPIRNIFESVSRKFDELLNLNLDGIYLQINFTSSLTKIRDNLFTYVFNFCGASAVTDKLKNNFHFAGSLEEKKIKKEEKEEDTVEDVVEVSLKTELEEGKKIDVILQALGKDETASETEPEINTKEELKAKIEEKEDTVVIEQKEPKIEKEKKKKKEKKRKIRNRTVHSNSSTSGLYFPAIAGTTKLNDILKLLELLRNCYNPQTKSIVLVSGIIGTFAFKLIEQFTGGSSIALQLPDGFPENVKIVKKWGNEFLEITARASIFKLVGVDIKLYITTSYFKKGQYDFSLTIFAGDNWKIVDSFPSLGSFIPVDLRLEKPQLVFTSFDHYHKISGIDFVAEKGFNAFFDIKFTFISERSITAGISIWKDAKSVTARCDIVLNEKFEFFNDVLCIDQPRIVIDTTSSQKVTLQSLIVLNISGKTYTFLVSGGYSNKALNLVVKGGSFCVNLAGKLIIIRELNITFNWNLSNFFDSRFHLDGKLEMEGKNYDVILDLPSHESKLFVSVDFHDTKHSIISWLPEGFKNSLSSLDKQLYDELAKYNIALTRGEITLSPISVKIIGGIYKQETPVVEGNIIIQSKGFVVDINFMGKTNQFKYPKGFTPTFFEELKEEFITIPLINRLTNYFNNGGSGGAVETLKPGDPSKFLSGNVVGGPVVDDEFVFTCNFYPDVLASYFVGHWMGLENKKSTGTGDQKWKKVRHNYDYDTFDIVFSPDIKLDMQADPKKYETNYDHGHLCPRQDMNFSETAVRTTYFVYNCVPQYYKFNREAWKYMEGRIYNAVGNMTGHLRSNNVNLYIITGTFNYTNSQIDTTIENRKKEDYIPPIPERMFKLVISDQEDGNCFPWIFYWGDNNNTNVVYHDFLDNPFCNELLDKLGVTRSFTNFTNSELDKYLKDYWNLVGLNLALTTKKRGIESKKKEKK